MVSTKCLKITLVAGVITTVFSAIMAGVWGLIFDFAIYKMLVLQEGTYSYDLWMDMPVDIYMNVYFFNWTNPEEVLVDKEKPIFSEMGPYVYRETRKRVVLDNTDEHFITYKNNKSWEYVPEKSISPTPDDSVTTIDPVLVSSLYMMESYPALMYMINSFAEVALKVPYITATVRELMFEGYEDPLIEIAKISEPIFGDMFPIPYDKFGWFYDRPNNPDYEGTFTMHNGKDDISQLGAIRLWNGAPESPAYSSYCGILNGSAGEFWGLGIDRTYIELFSVDICRSLKLTYEKDVVLYGLDAYKYVLDDQVFANTPENYCFDSYMWKSGVLNASHCKFDTPALVSYPHFYAADPSYVEAIEGLYPIREVHETRLTMEPETSVPMNIRAAFQVNLAITPYEQLSMMKDLPEVVFPMLWFSCEADIGEDMASDLVMMKRCEKLIGLFFALIGVGVLQSAVSGYLLWKRTKGNKQRKTSEKREILQEQSSIESYERT